VRFLPVGRPSRSQPRAASRRRIAGGLCDLGPGLAIATTKHGDELFAADFRTGAVDVFDSEFRQVKPAAWQFRDPGDRARQLAGGRLAPDRELR
jgi:hypothetical protein